MGWKGTLRSMQASSRRIERGSAQRKKQQAKRQQLNNAAITVHEYEESIARITSPHINRTSKKMDWEVIAIQNPPSEPEHLNNKEAKAQHSYDNFKPTLFHKIFRMEARKKKNLYKLIGEASQKDKQEYQDKFEHYLAKYKSWEKMNSLAQRLLKKDPKAYIDTIRELNPFAKLDGICAGVEFSVSDDGNFTVNVMMHCDKLIPKEKYSLRQSGTLSTKQIPKGERNQLYQSYVCSCLLHIMADVFSLLPIESMLINANDNLLDPVTGHIKKQTILSVMAMRKNFENLNLDMVDPSDSMENFVHNMSFKKTTGFEIIEPVTFIYEGMV